MSKKLPLPSAKKTVSTANMLVPIGITAAGLFLAVRKENTLGQTLVGLTIIGLGGFMAFKEI